MAPRRAPRGGWAATPIADARISRRETEGDDRDDDKKSRHEGASPSWPRARDQPSMNTVRAPRRLMSDSMRASLSSCASLRARLFGVSTTKGSF